MGPHARPSNVADAVSRPCCEVRGSRVDGSTGWSWHHNTHMKMDTEGNVEGERCFL